MATVERYLPALDSGALLSWAAVVNAEVLVTLAYVVATPSVPTDPLTYVYPWVWLNVAGWAVYTTRPAPSSRRTRALAAVGGVAYFAVVGYAGGLFHLTGAGLGFAVHWLPPGWGPAVTYSASAFTLVLLPFKVVGYAALAYLVAVTVVDASASALSGLLGLVSCVSCTWPVLATIVTGAFGSASALTALATTRAYGLSTVVFVASVLLLRWRPSL